jgi:hypothetical protein
MRFAKVVVLFLFAATAAAQTQTRLSWQEFAKDPNRVASFRKAVATMKSRNTAAHNTAAYRTSWEYWGAMHGYFGTNSKVGTVANYIQRLKNQGIWQPGDEVYFAGISNLTPPDATAQAVWDQCQHGTPYFFPWHRLYLYYFERVLRAAAGDNTLRLPYWDYTNVSNLAMPVEFTTPTYKNAQGQTVSNPLYDARRAPGWNIPTTVALPQGDTNINNALTIVPFSGSSGFQSAIEGGVHGNVHCDVQDCPLTVMGAVAYSSNDPIFWLHHCNIDRMWDCWKSIAGHNNPGSPWTTKQFSYINETGAKVTKTISVLFDGSLIDYKYQQASNCARTTTAVAVAASADVAISASAAKAAKTKLAKPVILGTKKSAAIDSPVKKHTISLPAEAKTPATAAAAPANLALHPSSQVPVKTELTLHGIHYAQHPGAQFQVYLERRDNPSRRALVGTISFFSDLGGSEHHGTAVVDRVFDVTEALQGLVGAGEGLADVNVVFQATSSRRGSTTAEAAAAPAPRFNAKSGLVVDEISLKVRSK